MVVSLLLAGNTFNVNDQRGIPAPRPQNKAKLQGLIVWVAVHSRSKEKRLRVVFLFDNVNYFTLFFLICNLSEIEFYEAYFTADLKCIEFLIVLLPEELKKVVNHR